MSALTHSPRGGLAPRRRRLRRQHAGWLGTVAAIVVFAGSVFPVYWMLNTSLLPNRLIRNYEPTFFPTEATLANYATLFQDSQFPFLLALGNSLMVTVITVVVALVFGFLAAVAATRFAFLGRHAFIVIILIVQMIPGEAMIISLYSMLDSWDMLNSIRGLSLLYVASVLPFTVWMLRGFAVGVPLELEEAARIDGCSRLGAFARVTFPLMAPGLIATGVFGFIQAWNEFVLALVVMSRPESLTLPVWLRSFQQANRGTDWGAIMAGSMLMSIPVVIFFLIVQSRMTSGLVSGAVKG